MAVLGPAWRPRQRQASAFGALHLQTRPAFANVVLRGGGAGANDA